MLLIKKRGPPLVPCWFFPPLKKFLSAGKKKALSGPFKFVLDITIFYKFGGKGNYNKHAAHCGVLC